MSSWSPVPFIGSKKLNGHMYRSHGVTPIAHRTHAYSAQAMGFSLIPLERWKITPLMFFMTWYYMSPDFIIGSILTSPPTPRPFTSSWLAANCCKLRRSNHILVIRLSSFSFCYWIICTTVSFFHWLAWNESIRKDFFLQLVKASKTLISDSLTLTVEINRHGQA